MYESKLETNVAGSKCLLCYYDPELRNWDSVIEIALLKHKLKSGECSILCLPMEKKK